MGFDGGWESTVGRSTVAREYRSSGSQKQNSHECADNVCEPYLT